MMRNGYGRLLAALVAAGGVHALILLSTGDTKILANGELSQLQVELVTADELRQEQSKPESVPEPATLKSSVAKSENKVAPAIAEEVASSEPPQTEVAYHAADGAVQSEARPEAAEPILTPASVQAVILTQISYPRLARKRGWEGQVHLSFDVSGRTVSGITLLKPCKHAALNEAAQDGLRQMQSVALADGRYWLPVVFRLQGHGL